MCRLSVAGGEKSGKVSAYFCDFGLSPKIVSQANIERGILRNIDKGSKESGGIPPETEHRATIRRWKRRTQDTTHAADCGNYAAEGENERRKKNGLMEIARTEQLRNYPAMEAQQSAKCG